MIYGWFIYLLDFPVLKLLVYPEGNQPVVASPIHINLRATAGSTWAARCGPLLTWITNQIWWMCGLHWSSLVYHQSMGIRLSIIGIDRDVYHQSMGIGLSIGIDHGIKKTHWMISCGPRRARMPNQYCSCISLSSGTSTCPGQERIMGTSPGWNSQVSWCEKITTRLVTR